MQAITERQRWKVKEIQKTVRKSHALYARPSPSLGPSHEDISRVHREPLISMNRKLRICTQTQLSPEVGLRMCLSPVYVITIILPCFAFSILLEFGRYAICQEAAAKAKRPTQLGTSWSARAVANSEQKLRQLPQSLGISSALSLGLRKINKN